MKYYILKDGDYYLSDIMVENGKLTNFTVDKDYRKLYSDFELAEDDRKLIFIETGLNLEIKRFRSTYEKDIEEDL